MKIQVLGSGSSGNCYIIDDLNHRIMLDCGLSFKTIQRAMDFKVWSVDACLITHEHKDHCRAAADLMKAGIPVWMSTGTSVALGLHGHRLKVVNGGGLYEMKNLYIYPFAVHHDAEEPLGYVVVGPKFALLYATDTAYLSQRFHNITHLLIECNNDWDTLDKNVEEGVIDPAYRGRVMKTHMSLTTLLKCLEANDLKTVKEIHLIHLSDKNADEEKFKRKVRRATGIPVYVH